MKFDKINRRTHLYLGLSLLPWFFMYGISSFPLAHKSKPARWSVTMERDYKLPPIEPGAHLDGIAAKVIQDLGLPNNGQFGAYQDGQGRLQIYMSRFITPTRLTYSPKTERLIVEKRDFALSPISVEMHVRGGFEKGGILHRFWSIIIDLVGIATVLWAASGVYMWWHLTRFRFWGWVAVSGGVLSFLFFLVRL